MAAAPKKAIPRAKLLPAAGVIPPSVGAANSQPAARIALPRLAGPWLILAFVVSFFAPIAGLTLGLLYAPQEDKAARNFGRWCLALAVLGWILAALTGAVRDAMGSGEWFIQPYY
jgi:hypothetical protein